MDRTTGTIHFAGQALPFWVVAIQWHRHRLLDKWLPQHQRRYVETYMALKSFRGAAQAEHTSDGCVRRAVHHMLWQMRRVDKGADWV